MYLLFSKFLTQRTVLLICVLFGAFTVKIPAQRQPVVPRYGVPSFSQLDRNSGFIFVGTVTSVGRGGATSLNGVGTVRITFHVENALRGVRRGQTLVIREWAGLWESGEQYRVGERVALFLFRPGKLGLTSPVGGKLGRFRVDSYGRVVLNQEHVAAISADPVLATPWRGRSRMTWKELSNGIRRDSAE
jgi:hypothetical protein